MFTHYAAALHYVCLFYRMNAVQMESPVEDNVVGAKLSEPLDQHHNSALRWWLICHGQPEPSKHATKAILISRWAK
jgi:hypothetical protein